MPESSNSSFSRRGPRRVIWTGVIIIGVAAATGVWWHERSANSSVAPAEGQAAHGTTEGGAGQGGAPAGPPVTVANPVVKDIIEWDEYPGQFRAINSIDVRARVSGYLEQIHFTDGQTVKEGDPLFSIEKRPFEISLESAHAQLAEADAQLSLANRNLKRYEKMREGNIVGEADYDDRVEAVSAAKAAVAVAQAQVREAELDLGYTEIRSPVTGRISRHEVSVGNLITGGYTGDVTLLTTIVSVAPIYFDFDMSEQNYLAYQRAAERGVMLALRDNKIKVFAKLPDEEGWVHEGSLEFLDNQVNETSGTIRARATFPNADGVFTPGQFAHVRVPGTERYTAILLPESAIVTDQSQKIALVVDGEGTVGVKILRVGPGYDSMRIIREGLAPTDVVIIDGLMRARPGSKVSPEMGKIDDTSHASFSE